MFDLDLAVKEGCRTRDGRPVRIICTDKRDADGDLLLLGLIDDGDIESCRAWYRDGVNFTGGDSYNLVNLPEAHEVTVQLYRAGEKYVLLGTVDGEPTWNRGPEGPTFMAVGKPQTIRIEKDEG